VLDVQPRQPGFPDALATLFAAARTQPVTDLFASIQASQ
jgi:hypothetical protein